MPTDIHLICQQGARHTNLGNPVWETGNWVVSDTQADNLVGGRVYLHSNQAEPAWHGGTIQSWRIAPDEPGRKIFRYVVDGDFRIKCRAGWGQEKAVVQRS